MYLRFVVTEINAESHQPQGLFITVGTLLTSGELDANESKRLREILRWFNENLPVPTASWIRGRATFWFREGAQEYILRMWELVAIFKAHGKLVEVQKCTFLANIIYDDAFQVAAYAHHRDGKRTFK